MISTTTATKPAAFYDGYERMMGMIRRHGWTQARDMFNAQRPTPYTPTSSDDYYNGEGMMKALLETM